MSRSFLFPSLILVSLFFLLSSSPCSCYRVTFTHCGSGSQCGGNQHCDNYEMALSNAGLWRDLGIPQPSGGVTTCPTSYFNSDEDCCDYEKCPDAVKQLCPSCPLDGKPSNSYPVCVKSESTGQMYTAYITGCCPSNHPCNFCKNAYGVPGGCSSSVDQADLCDNLWYALGSPDQSTFLDVNIGAC